MFDLFASKSQPRISMGPQTNPYASIISNYGPSFTVEISKIMQPLSVKDMEQTMKKSECFFKAIDSWKTLQQSYISKLTQIQTSFREKVCIDNKDKNQENKRFISLNSTQMIDNQLITLFDTLIKNHKGMFQKITYDISYVNLQTFQALSKQIKQIVNEQKKYVKELGNVKDQLERVFNKKTKLRKQKQEELMLKIFMEDGNQQFTMDQKIKKNNKYNQVKKQYQQYELKVSESVDQFHKSSENLKKNHLQYYQKIDRLNQCKYQTVMKMQLHLLTYYRNLVQGINNLSKEIQIFMDQGFSMVDSPKKQTKNKIIFDQMERNQKQNKKKIQQNRRNQFEILEKLIEKRVGYVQYSLRIIDQKQFDDLLIYSKDKEVKTKIKRMIDSNEVNPVQTDETCRQIQLIKKLIKNSSEEPEAINIFKTMISKNSKMRMNFIFILQFFRINGKFQMTIQQFKPIYSLINQFLQICHENRDCFVLKQLMILLTTYYVILEEENLPFNDQGQQDSKNNQNNTTEEKKLSPSLQLQISENKKKQNNSSSSTKQKIYILQFFRDHELWHDIQFWQSLLIECIYSQKRNTIKNLVRGLQSTTEKKEMLDAQKKAILNQMLYVVRNMIIFDFSQKQVKSFGLKYCKLLKQDDRSLKDVYKTIEEAIKEELQTMQFESIDKYKQKLLK